MLVPGTQPPSLPSADCWSSLKYRVLLATGKASQVLRRPDCLATLVHAHLAYLDLCSSHFHLLASPRTTSRNARRLSHALRRPLSADLSASALNSLPQPYCPAVVLLPPCRLAAPSLRLSISPSDSPLCVIHDPCVASASICPAAATGWSGQLLPRLQACLRQSTSRRPDTASLRRRPAARQTAPTPARRRPRARPPPPRARKRPRHWPVVGPVC